MVRDHLALALAAAVPLEIARLRALPEEERAREIKAHTGQAVAVLLGEHGDDLLFGGRHCAEAFAALATGLACLAFTPGGVRFAGLHFCADHTQCQAAEGPCGRTPTRPYACGPRCDEHAPGVVVRG